jgi:peroxiredoxin Q/BCP
MGRKYFGTHRVTFLIGPEGTVKAVWPEVKPKEHARQVMAALEAVSI